jgi:drug/metabolite transporter (DMT)-like permease
MQAVDLRTVAFTGLALGCFAANSLLCRAALRPPLVDPATFTSVRLLSGAVALAVILAATRRARPAGGSFGSALSLFSYAAGFSIAYTRIGAGIGALLLFAAVQVTMVGRGVARGDRPSALQWTVLALALGGLAYLALASGLVPSPVGAALMVTAGLAWGVYSLRGRGASEPLAVNADNFLRTLPFTLVLSGLLARGFMATRDGVLLAIASGAVASGGGYSLWYAVVPALGATRAAAVQLAVPLLAGLGATVFLGEVLTARVAMSGAAILAGVALVLRRS